jgi:hypothetical protein
MRNRERKALQQRQLEESEALQDGSNRGTAKDHPDTQAGLNAGLSADYMALPRALGPASPSARLRPAAGYDFISPPPSMFLHWPTMGIEDMEPESKELPTEVRLEPIRVWRALDIKVVGNNVALGAMNASFGKFLAGEHEAECKDSNDSWLLRPTVNIYGREVIQPNRHVAPELHCKCGFYGVKEKKDVMDGTIFIAEAEFYGKVIEHDTGYRAQFQRILSVRVERPALCFGAFLCDGEPAAVWFTESSQQPANWGASTYPPVVICQTCALEIAAHGGKVATLGKLAARLGVEVRWDA